MNGGEGSRLRVLFVCVSDFSSPGEKQALGFAQELRHRGHEVLMSISGDERTAAAEGVPPGGGLDVRARRFQGRGLSRDDLEAARRFEPDVIHAFTPRVPVVAAARSFARATSAPVLMHFEDDDWGLRKGMPGASLARRAARAGRRALSRLHPPAWYYATRASLRWAARTPAALDALTPALAREVEARTGRKCAVLLPVSPRRSDDDAQPGQPAEDGERFALYTGALAPAQMQDFGLALAAVAELWRRGHGLRLVHTGAVLGAIDRDRMARESGLPGDALEFRGYVGPDELQRLLRGAAVLLQPGAPSDYNRLRLPSKLQAYLASGTPTVTFAVGSGELLEDGREALLTRTGDPSELAERIRQVLDDSRLAAALGEGGRSAAARLFDRQRNTDALVSHYRSVVGETGSG